MQRPTRFAADFIVLSSLDLLGLVCSAGLAQVNWVWSGKSVWRLTLGQKKGKAASYQPWWSTLAVILTAVSFSFSSLIWILKFKRAEVYLVLSFLPISVCVNIYCQETNDLRQRLTAKWLKSGLLERFLMLDYLCEISCTLSYLWSNARMTWAVSMDPHPSAPLGIFMRCSQSCQWLEQVLCCTRLNGCYIFKGPGIGGANEGRCSNWSTIEVVIHDHGKLWGKGFTTAQLIKYFLSKH